MAQHLLITQSQLDEGYKSLRALGLEETVDELAAYWSRSAYTEVTIEIIEPQPEAEPEAEPQPEAEPEPEAKVEPEAKPKPATKGKGKPKGK